MEYDLKMQEESLFESLEEAIVLAEFGELWRRLEKVVGKGVVEEEGKRKKGRRKKGKKEGGRREEGGLESAWVVAEEIDEAEVAEEDEDH